MGQQSLEGMLEATDYDSALRWHLSNNHFPPVPSSMVIPCKNAIQAVIDGMPDKEIQLPGQTSWRGRDNAPAWAIIEGHHLESFLGGLTDEDYDY
jgi:hypothetical protein